MTGLRLCQPATTQRRQRGALDLPKDEQAMHQNLYVAELLGVLPEPLPLELAEAVATTLAIGVDEIGTGQLPDEGGTSRWGVFRVHLVVRTQARAETAALWLARELGDPHRACILRDWREPGQGLAGGAV
ncbi:hypothetical protein E5198_11960 [Pseudomonas sp. A-1]|nr:hypothetical protein E5198_11960 [Pseudomonas sp. A-1]